jgi:hypothetical protein
LNYQQFVWVLAAQPGSEQNNNRKGNKRYFDAPEIFFHGKRTLPDIGVAASESC